MIWKALEADLVAAFKKEFHTYWKTKYCKPMGKEHGSRTNWITFSKSQQLFPSNVLHDAVIKKSGPGHRSSE